MVLLGIIRTGCVRVLDHLLGPVTDGVVDLPEGLLCGEQVVFLEERPSLFGQTAELPGVALPLLVVMKPPAWSIFHRRVRVRRDVPQRRR